MALFRRRTSETNAVANSVSPGTVAKTSPLPSATEAVIRALANTFDASSDPVTIADKGGIIRYINVPFCAMTGYGESEVLGKTPRILKSGKHDGFFYQNMWNVLLSGQAWQGETINKKKDGTLYNDAQTITPILQGDGDISCFVSVRHDVTAQRESEREQRRQIEELSIPKAIDELIARARTSEEVLGGAVDTLLGMGDFSAHSKGVAFVVEAPQNRLRMVAARGSFSARFLADEATIPLGACLCGRAAVEGRVLTCSNCFDDFRHEHKWLGMKAHGHYTIPVRTSTRVLAVINLYSDANVDSSDRTIAFLASIGFRLGAGMERTLARNEMQS